MLFINYLTENPVFYVTWVLCIVVSIVLHELGHGVAALQQGDTTPRDLGHMTLNPMVHMGGLSIAMVLIAGIGFGMMPVNPRRFKSRYGDAIVSFAGPATNLILAFISLTVAGLWVRFTGYNMSLSHPLILFGGLNFVLCLFNLLPVPPLDGSTVLANFSPGYKALIRNPDNQPFMMGAFLLIFYFGGRIFQPAFDLAESYVRLLV